MPPILALLGCAVFIIVLFYFESINNSEASFSLWIPFCWLAIMSSRPIGGWLPATTTMNPAEGSPYDRFVLNILGLLALWVLVKSHIGISDILKANYWLFVLYIYLGISVLWSDYPFVSFKRWVKIAESVVVAFVIMREKERFQALESLLRRCAYLLIPLSLVLIKYFPEYGVQFDRWEGVRMGTGVTTQKNSLGLLCALSSLFFIWGLLRKWRTGATYNTRYLAFCDTLTLIIALFLLFGGGGSYSATAILIFSTGIACLAILTKFNKLLRYTARHLKLLILIGVILFYAFCTLLMPTLTSILGRSESLSGRDEIWRSVIDVASDNMVLGVGYGGYWGVNEEAYTRHHEVMQSHSGYLEVWLQAGIVGLGFLFVFLLNFCTKIQRLLHHSPEWGMFGVCFLVMLLFYNYTEAAFIEANCLWTTTVFLTVVFSEVYLRD